MLAGRHGWVTPVSQSVGIHDRLPASRLETLERSGHMTFIDEPEAFLRHVADFLAGAAR